MILFLHVHSVVSFSISYIFLPSSLSIEQMNFHMFISRLFLIFLDACFFVSICAFPPKQETAWHTSNGVKCLDILIMFAMWPSLVFIYFCAVVYMQLRMSKWLLDAVKEFGKNCSEILKNKNKNSSNLCQKISKPSQPFLACSATCCFVAECGKAVYLMVN